MIEEIIFPREMNADMKVNIVADKVNELVRNANGEKEVCSHKNDRLLKNGRHFCDDCKRFIK